MHIGGWHNSILVWIRRQRVSTLIRRADECCVSYGTSVLCPVAGDCNRQDIKVKELWKQQDTTA
jgi:hypothetical protein